jgi:hypothetical protein
LKAYGILYKVFIGVKTSKLADDYNYERCGCGVVYWEGVGPKSQTRPDICFLSLPFQHNILFMHDEQKLN